MNVDGHEVITDIVEAVSALSKDTTIAIDTETTGLSPWHDRIARMQLYGDDTGTCAVLPIKNGVIPWQIMDLFKPGKLFIGHNMVSFDLLLLDQAGVPWRDTNWYDTLVGETVVTSTGRRNTSVSLRKSVKRHLGLEIKKDIEHGHWENEELTDEQMEYAARDVLSLPAMRRSQLEKATRTRQMSALEMEMELLPAVVEMVLTGLPLDQHKMQEFMEGQQVKMDDSRRQLYEKLGPINLNSHPQLTSALLGIGIDMPSTAKEILEDAVNFGGPAGDIAQLLMDYRHPAKRLGMYDADWLTQYLVNGWIHSRFWQCSADTGRFTSSDPNLQQWPKDMRVVIGDPEHGYWIISCDYSQIEVRISAELANDTALIDLMNYEDIHTKLASMVLEIPMDKISARQRKLAKALTFTLLFGGGSEGLYDYAKRQGSSIDLPEAYRLRRWFFSTFTGLNAMLERAQRTAQREGPVVVRLPNGLRRLLVGRNKRPTVILNTSVQGSAAVGIKYGIIDAHKHGLVRGQVGAQVHDELVAAIKVPTRKQAEEYGHELHASMIRGMERILHKVPVKAELKVGEYWQP